MRSSSVFVLLLVALSAPVFGAITVGVGTSLNFANASVDLGCSDLTIAGTASASGASFSNVASLNLSGTFSPGASNIGLGGVFSNSGTFTPGTSRVAIVDACGGGTSAFVGATNFYDLIVSSSSGRSLVFPIGAAQNVAHSMTLQGVAGNLLTVRSPIAGVPGALVLSAGATQTIAYVNARDNNASGGATIAPGAASSYNSVDSGGLTNWFASAVTLPGGGAPVPTPMLGVGRCLLLLGLLTVGIVAVRRRTN